MALIVGTQWIGTGAMALNNGVSLQCSQVLLQTDPDNAVDVFIGNVGSQPIQVQANHAISIPVSNLNEVYAKTSSSSALLSWLSI